MKQPMENIKQEVYGMGEDGTECVVFDAEELD